VAACSVAAPGRFRRRPPPAVAARTARHPRRAARSHGLPDRVRAPSGLCSHHSRSCVPGAHLGGSLVGTGRRTSRRGTAMRVPRSARPPSNRDLSPRLPVVLSISPVRASCPGPSRRRSQPGRDGTPPSSIWLEDPRHAPGRPGLRIPARAPYRRVPVPVRTPPVQFLCSSTVAAQSTIAGKLPCVAAGAHRRDRVRQHVTDPLLDRLAGCPLRRL